MKPSGIGGMAVMEGVMMRNKEEYAVAVRKPNNEIAVEKSVHKDFANQVKLFKLPIFRGMLAFVDSMVVGVKVLNYSASFFEDEEEDKSKNKKNKKEKSKRNAESIDSDFEIEEVAVPDSDVGKAAKKNPDKAGKKDDSTMMMVCAVLLSIVLSVALFMVLPVFLTQLISHFIKSTFLMNLIEGLVRLGIFIGYVVIAALMPEIKRTFMYHGAEHKTINCLEHGYELTVPNVRKHSKQHKRCGTSFMLLVILISLVFFMIIPTGNLLWRVLSRVLLVPFIAGVSYEFIRLAGKSENKVVEVLSKPGLWMQGLTTREPDDSMIEVAIQSVDAVFDWRSFLEESKKDSKNAVSIAKKHSNYQSDSGKQTNTPKQTSAAQSIKAEKKTDKDKHVNYAKQENEIKQMNSAAHTGTVNQKSNVNAKQSDTSKQGNTADAKQAGAVKQQDHQKKANTSNIDKAAVTKHKAFDEEEEDDEILKALDKYFDSRDDKAAEGK